MSPKKIVTTLQRRLASQPRTSAVRPPGYLGTPGTSIDIVRDVAEMKLDLYGRPVVSDSGDLSEQGIAYLTGGFSAVAALVETTNQLIDAIDVIAPDPQRYTPVAGIFSNSTTTWETVGAVTIPWDALGASSWRVDAVLAQLGTVGSAELRVYNPNTNQTLTSGGLVAVDPSPVAVQELGISPETGSALYLIQIRATEEGGSVVCYSCSFTVE